MDLARSLYHALKYLSSANVSVKIQCKGNGNGCCQQNGCGNHVKGGEDLLFHHVSIIHQNPAKSTLLTKKVKYCCFSATPLDRSILFCLLSNPSVKSHPFFHAESTHSVICNIIIRFSNGNWFNYLSVNLTRR
jgi:hypothetical protein